MNEKKETRIDGLVEIYIYKKNIYITLICIIYP